MFTLKTAEHLIEPDKRKIVEIWNGDVLMGVIYPTNQGIKLVSKYIANNPEAAIKVDKSELPPLPTILINLI